MAPPKSAINPTRVRLDRDLIERLRAYHHIGAEITNHEFIGKLLASYESTIIDNALRRMSGAKIIPEEVVRREDVELRITAHGLKFIVGDRSAICGSDGTEMDSRWAMEIPAGTARTFAAPIRQLQVRTDGKITMRLTGDGSDVTIPVRAGQELPFAITHIRKGTTADVLAIG